MVIDDAPQRSTACRGSSGRPSGRCSGHLCPGAAIENRHGGDRAAATETLWDGHMTFSLNPADLVREASTHLGHVAQVYPAGPHGLWLPLSLLALGWSRRWRHDENAEQPALSPRRWRRGTRATQGAATSLTKQTERTQPGLTNGRDRSRGVHRRWIPAAPRCRGVRGGVRGTLPVWADDFADRPVHTRLPQVVLADRRWPPFAQAGASARRRAGGRPRAMAATDGTAERI